MSDNASGMNAMVAIIAIIVIAAVGYFAVVMLRDNEANEPGINVNLGGGDGNTGN